MFAKLPHWLLSTTLLRSGGVSDDTRSHNDHLSSLRPVEPSSFAFSAIPAPVSPNAFWNITVIRTGQMHAPKQTFIAPSKDEEMSNAPILAFLIERFQEDGVTKRIMFDLGIRETAKFTQPRYRTIAEAWKNNAPPGAVASTLQSHSIPLESISELILGHAHFDHVGNLADYPSSMSLLVGPGSPMGDELAFEMDVPYEVISSRVVRQLSRTEDQWEDIGTFRGFDHSGDGSLWVLDVPGHAPGHIGALVRTSVSPPVYHLLGSDTAHTITLITQSRTDRVGLWSETALNPAGDPAKLSCMHADLEEAYNSMAKLRRMEEEENVHVLLAHDRSMDFILPTGDFIPLEGTLEEVERFKRRNQFVD